MDNKIKLNAKYSVSLYISRANLPFFFAVHPWFVVNSNGVVSRWEVLFKKNSSNVEFGYIHKNYLPQASGIEIFPFTKKFLWQGKLLGSLEGNAGSEAERMVEFIENSSLSYLNKDKYSFFGPNSNTYAQWVLSHFPGFKPKLPKNAFGKGYGK
jgi:hypothetical protein